MSYPIGDDASVPLIVRDASGGAIAYDPVVHVKRNGVVYYTVTGTWVAAAAPEPGSTTTPPSTSRTIRVPTSTLAEGVWALYLVIPGDADLHLDDVYIQGAGDGGTVVPVEPGEPGGGVSVDHGAMGATLAISQAGSHEGDLTVNAAVTVSTTGDVSLRLHGTGQTVTVAGETFTIDGTAVILVVTWPRGQDAYLIGEGTGGEETPDPGDTTPPSAGTLTATGGEGQVSLSVAGAADETALHATPYSFSADGGTTYGAWQAGSTKTVTGLTAGSYTCRHRVRDAAGNISPGATKTATVTAPAGWNVFATDTFTAPDNTIVDGHQTDTGGLTWVRGFGSPGSVPDYPNAYIVGGKFISRDGNAYHYLPFTRTASGFRVTIDYSLVIQGGGVCRLVMRLYQRGSIGFLKAGSSGIEVEVGDGATLVGSATTPPDSGTLVMEFTGSAVTFKVNGTLIASGTLSGPVTNAEGLYIRAAGSTGTNSGIPSMDNIVLEDYS